MRGYAEAFKNAAYHGSSFAQIEANQAFHFKFYSFCRNDVLRELMLDLRQRGPAAPVGQWQTMHQLQQATQGHFELVDAIEKRDLTLLRSAITDHISGNRTASAEPEIE